MAKVFIFSTLATDMLYTEWMPTHDSGAMAGKGREVFVKGGTGVANDRVVTPQGVRTEIEDDDLASLQNNEVFKLHVKNGFITYQKKSADPEKVAADMKLNDPSSPRTPSDPDMADEKGNKILAD